MENEIKILEIGDRVKKIKGDYKFEGTIVARFSKLSGLIRVVVEHDDGILHIFNDAQLEKIEND